MRIKQNKSRTSAHKEWAKESVLNLIKKMVQERNEIIREGVDKYHVFVAKPNAKGAASSVSTIPVFDCSHNASACSGKCYDVCHDCIKKQVRKTRAINSAIYSKDPERFFREINGVCKALSSFRYNVGGDIKDMFYMQKVVDVAIDNPHCSFHIFTKSYDIVNDWIAVNGNLPSNLFLRFSEWPGIPMPNPHNLNICRIQMKDEIIEYKDGVVLCTKNCAYCDVQKVNCFDRNVKVVVIPEH